MREHLNHIIYIQFSCYYYFILFSYYLSMRSTVLRISVIEQKLIIYNTYTSANFPHHPSCLEVRLFTCLQQNEIWFYGLGAGETFAHISHPTVGLYIYID